MLLIYNMAPMTDETKTASYDVQEGDIVMLTQLTGTINASDPPTSSFSLMIEPTVRWHQCDDQLRSLQDVNLYSVVPDDPFKDAALLEDGKTTPQRFKLTNLTVVNHLIMYNCVRITEGTNTI